MPIFSFRCTKCSEEFETLVMGSESPTCPACSSSALERLVSAPSVGGKTEAALGRVRQQAAREGHFSNYSRSELKGRV
ncbi:FmdB family zinc ribbon protein [Magnetospirillum molischianum]|uniref:Putative regulatory protein FmdB zinc ribbon domain-containing protein n=1 Tax=Magnetospirillum molischianum DSM 120 TaxID=1150626 RepID=H8FU35_MAGML|nr:zinc ribbon domain-containing protein [Magnetospirillum molischianum]CCG41873.1 conserved hypothetical protein [Magnetospirillum molischianum DSM 120]